MASATCSSTSRSLHQALSSRRALESAHQRESFSSGRTFFQPKSIVKGLASKTAQSKLIVSSPFDQSSSLTKQVTINPVQIGRQDLPHARRSITAAANPFAQLLKRFSSPTENREELKGELLELISGLDRGVDATEEEKAEVDKLASRLEAINPNPKSLSSPLINGKWKLLYTTSESILGAKKPKLLRPSGDIFQYIDTEQLAAKNTETWPFFNQVTAKLTPESPSQVKVQFQYFKIFGLIPVKAPDSARGYLDTTYVDEDLRISRGDKGNLFVLQQTDNDARLG